MKEKIIEEVVTGQQDPTLCLLMVNGLSGSLQPIQFLELLTLDFHFKHFQESIIFSIGERNGFPDPRILLPIGLSNEKIKENYGFISILPYGPTIEEKKEESRKLDHKIQAVTC